MLYQLSRKSCFQRSRHAWRQKISALDSKISRLSVENIQQVFHQTATSAAGTEYNDSDGAAVRCSFCPVIVMNRCGLPHFGGSIVFCNAVDQECCWVLDTGCWPWLFARCALGDFAPNLVAARLGLARLPLVPSCRRPPSSPISYFLHLLLVKATSS